MSARLAYTDLMNLLALDTSTERLCLALCLGHEVLAHEEPGGDQASRHLLPAAQALLAKGGLSWQGLHGLAYGEGPGAFTGIRSACAAAQGLALGLDVPAVPVPSLRIVAENALQEAWRRGVLREGEPCRVGVAVDARMGQVYDDQAQWDGQRWHSIRGPAVRDPAAVCEEWAGHGTASNWLCAGSGLDLMPGGTAQRLKGQCLLWMAHEVDRPAALARVAMAAWAQGPRLDAAQLMPVYVRDRVALTTAERAAARRAAFTGVPSTDAMAKPLGAAQ